jgi:sorting and assembly machinery component 37
MLASLYPVPQCYYVPHRIRALHAPRLDASGLWDLSGEEVRDFEAEKQQAKFSRDGKPPAAPPLDRTKIWKNAFFRERVIERARLAFEPYARLLDTDRFFFYDRWVTSSSS